MAASILAHPPAGGCSLLAGSRRQQRLASIRRLPAVPAEKVQLSTLDSASTTSQPSITSPELEASIGVPTDPSTSYEVPSSRSGFGIPLPALGLAGVAVAALVMKKLSKSGSAGSLVSRGYLNESRGKSDAFYSDVMKNVNTVRIDELSDEQILAARARRSRERANHKLTLEDIELPENHPFAVKAPVTPEEEQAIKQRLSVKNADNNGNGRSQRRRR